MTSLFILALALARLARASPTSILDHHLLPRQEENPTYTPSPTSAATSTPNSSPPSTSTNINININIKLVFSSAREPWCLGKNNNRSCPRNRDIHIPRQTNIICASRPYKPTDDELAGVWRQYGRGKSLYWTHGIDAVDPDERECICDYFVHELTDIC